MNHDLKQKDRFRRRKLFSYAWKCKRTFLPGVLLEGLAMAADLAAPLLVANILNRQVPRALQTKDSSLVIQTLAATLLWYLLSVLASSGLRYGSGLLLQSSANHLARIMQVDVFSYLQKLPISYFDRLPAGKVVSRVMNDTKAVKNLFASVLVRLLSASIYGIGIYFTLIFLDRNLFFLALLPLPFLYLIFRDFQSKSARHNYEARRSLSDLNGQLNEDIQGMEVIQSLGCEERIRERFEKTNRDLFEVNLKLTRLWSYSSYNMTTALRYAIMALILLYFGYGSVSGKYFVPVGSLYLFVDYMGKFFEQVHQAMQRISDLERARGAADHIFELLREEAVSEESGELSGVRGEVEFRDARFAYLDEEVIRGISFRVKANETAAFVGATGSGKSTLMNLLFGFYPLGSGQILIDGRDLSDLPLSKLRSHMAIVLQDPVLFSGTLYSNIALNRNLSPEEAEKALREVGGGPMLDRLKKGIHSPVSERGQGYSSGEKQLITFARALVRDPRILVLDEATASIDSETEALIQEGIRRLKKGRTTFLIAHRLSTIRHASQIYVLRRGEICERGTHEDLMKKDGIYAEMVREQTRENSDA